MPTMFRRDAALSRILAGLAVLLPLLVIADSVGAQPGKKGRPSSSRGPSPEQILRNQLADLDRQKRELLDEQKRLPDELAGLEADLAELRTWQEVDLVIGGVTSPAVIGLEQQGEGWLVAATASGPRVKPAVSAARNGDVMRINSIAARDLARKALGKVQPGSPLPSDLDRLFRETVWKPQRYAPVGPEVPDPQFVVFRDAGRDAPRVGFLVSATPDGFTYQTVGQTKQEMPRNRVLVGSVLSDRGKDIIPALEEGESFLDYCILNVAQKVSSSPDSPGHVALSVQTKVDGIEDLIERSKEGIGVVHVNFGRWFGITTSESNYRSQYASRADAASQSQSQRDYVSGYDGFRGNFGSRGVASGQSRSRADFQSQFKSQGTSERKSEANWETGSTIRDPNRDLADALRKLSRQAEDKLYARLVDMGLPVVEREQLEEVEDERERRAGGSERDLADRLDATHVLVAEIDEPEASGRFRLSMRLIDVRTGQVLWAANGDETAPKSDAYNKFILNSGRIAKVKIPKEAQEMKAKLVENPPLVPIGVAAAAARLPDEMLAIVEEDMTSSAGSLYRPLFGNEPFFPETPLEISPIDTIDAVQRDVKVRDQLLRYVTWKLALECLTPAGRVLKVESDGSSVLTSLGGAHGVQRGDTLRVMQRMEAPTGSTGGGGEMLLPVSLKVAEVYDSYSRAIVGHSGLGDAWNDDEYRPGSGDLVVSRFDEPQPIAVFPAVIDKPQTPKADRDSKWNENRGYRNKAISAMVSLRDNINGQLQDSLSKIGVSVFGEKPVYQVDKYTDIPTFDEAATCGAAYDKGARLAIGGIITPIDTVKYQFELKLIRLQPQPNGEVKLGEVVYADRAIVTSERGLR